MITLFSSSYYSRTILLMIGHIADLVSDILQQFIHTFYMWVLIYYYIQDSIWHFLPNYEMHRVRKIAM